MPTGTDLPTLPDAVARYFFSGDPGSYEALTRYVQSVLAPYLQGKVLPEAQPVSVVDCTSMLAAIDSLALQLVRYVLDYGDYDRTALAALDSNPARLLIHCEQWSDELRRLRRSALHTAVAHQLFDARGYGPDLSAFVEQVVWPLLCRKWLPSLWYDPSSLLTDNARGEPYVSPGCSRAELTIDISTFVRTHCGDILGGTVMALKNSDYRGQPIATATYLEKAVETALAYRLGLKPYSTNVLETGILLAPSDDALSDGWPCGHLIRAIVVPSQIACIAALTRQSYERAYRCAASFPGVDALLPTEDWAVVLGDYPGGVSYPKCPRLDGCAGGDEECPTVADGESASLSIAAALVAGAAKLNLKKNALATARVEGEHVEQGKRDWFRVAPLHNLNTEIPERWLAAKGTTLALAALERSLLVVADKEDQRQIMMGVRQVQGAKRTVLVQPIQDVQDAIRCLIDLDYRDPDCIWYSPATGDLRTRSLSRIVRKLASNSLDSRRICLIVPNPSADRTYNQLVWEHGLMAEFARQVHNGHFWDRTIVRVTLDELHDNLVGRKNTLPSLITRGVDIPLAYQALVEQDIREGRLAFLISKRKGAGGAVDGAAEDYPVTVIGSMLRRLFDLYPRSRVLLTLSRERLDENLELRATLVAARFRFVDLEAQ